MSDKLKTDSIDFIATKQDFIELMDENVRLQNELQQFVERACAVGDKLASEAIDTLELGVIRRYQKALRDEFTDK